ncbi:MAG: hypothetical protein HYY12_01840 [Candidatus Methylomirabilis oxyfera]|nr:hypothetical protein [Candidatus Methylomirabilis oxyfera]
MRGIRQARSNLLIFLSGFVGAAFLTVTAAFAADIHTSKPFTGKTVNGGTVTHSKKAGKHVLTLSDDFKVPGSPDPHWRVIDSKGNVYLLNRLTIKGEKEKEDKVNKIITLPGYIRDVAKVEMWCAWAEVVLGEAPFAAPLK